MNKKPSVMIWLTAAGLCMGLLPDLALSVCGALRKEPLQRAASFGIGLAAACIGLICLLRAVYLRFGKETGDTENFGMERRKPELLSCLLGLFPCILVCMAALYSADGLLPVLAALYPAAPGIFWIVAGLLSAVFLLLLGILFFCYLGNCRPDPLKQPVRRFFRRIYQGFPMAVLLLLALLASPFLVVLTARLWEQPGNLIRHLAMLFGALAAAFLLQAAFHLAEQMMTGAQFEREPEKLKKNRLPYLLCLLACAFLFLSQNLSQFTGNQTALLETELKEALMEYSFFLASSDIGAAAGIAGEAAEKMDNALEAARETEEEAAGDPALLRKAGKNTKALEKVCEQYSVFREDGRALGLIYQYKKMGSVDQDLAEEALDLSEEYPENLQVQYTASLLGSSLRYDNAKHYDRTAEAVLRWEKLCRMESALTGEEKLKLAKEAAQMLITVYHQEEALELLDSYTDNTSDVEICELMARCYDSTGRQEEAYALAADCCETGMDSPYLIYYAALSALKLGKTEESLAYTSMLASYTTGCEGEELKDCDTWLFELLEFLTLKDNAAFTEFQYAVYENLTEKEQALVNENPFFRNYLDAVYLAYSSDQKEEPEEAIAKIQAVLETKPELASAWYVYGVIASNADSEEYSREAVSCYEKAGELNEEIPAVWYAMAREYDRLGEYEKGIEACKKALAFLPDQDHGTDWYGIHYHCSRLLRSLEREVNQ